MEENLMTKSIIIFSLLFLIIGFLMGRFVSHARHKPLHTTSNQSDTQPGELMRGAIPLIGTQWIDAHFMSRDCDPKQAVQISTHKHMLYYICVKR